MKSEKKTKSNVMIRAVMAVAFACAISLPAGMAFAVEGNGASEEPPVAAEPAAPAADNPATPAEITQPTTPAAEPQPETPAAEPQPEAPADNEAVQGGENPAPAVDGDGNPEIGGNDPDNEPEPIVEGESAPEGNPSDSGNADKQKDKPKSVAKTQVLIQSLPETPSTGNGMSQQEDPQEYTDGNWKFELRVIDSVTYAILKSYIGTDKSTVTVPGLVSIISGENARLYQTVIDDKSLFENLKEYLSIVKFVKARMQDDEEDWKGAKLINGEDLFKDFTELTTVDASGLDLSNARACKACSRAVNP